MSDSGVTDGLTVDAPGEARMSTTISVLGGVALSPLGMSVMTGGLKALAGSGLRTTLSKAAATPPSGTFWGDHDARERQAHAGVGRVHGSGCGLHFETASASSPNAGTTSKALVIPMVNSTGVCTAVLKPVAVTSTRYSPGGTCVIRYFPVSSVLAERFAPVARLVAVCPFDLGHRGG
jgi:hypothetical protein